MTISDWIDRQERDANLILVYEMTRNLAKNDARKQRWHDGDCSVSKYD